MIANLVDNLLAIVWWSATCGVAPFHPKAWHAMSVEAMA